MRFEKQLFILIAVAFITNTSAQYRKNSIITQLPITQVYTVVNQETNTLSFFEKNVFKVTTYKDSNVK